MSESSRRINWGQVSISVILLLLSLTLTVVLGSHSSAISQNSLKIEINTQDIKHLQSDSLTVQERERLCSAIAVLDSSVQDLKSQVNRIQQLTK